MKNIFQNRTVVGLSSIFLSLIICFGITPLFNSGLKAKTEVVRISKDLKEGDIITSDKISVVEVGAYNLPDNVVKTKEKVMGKYAKADLMKGDYIFNSKISDDPLAENKYLYELDGNKQAISITIKSFAAGLSGKLESGDIISIIASDFGEFRETITPAELQYVRVLAATTNQGNDSNYSNDKKEDEEKAIPSTITLIVNKAQAKLLAELEEKSKIHVSLVYRGTEENAKKFLEEQERVINPEIFKEQQEKEETISNETTNPAENTVHSEGENSMKNNQIIAIWGSPSAGKTTTSIKLARELSLKKKNVILVMCDTLCPELMSVLPKTDISNKSIGSLLALPEITQEHILSKCITLDKNQYITLLGYAQGENIFTYAQYSKERAIDFLILLRHLADYVIVDCSSGFTGDVLSTVALEMADMVLRLGKANLKSVSYFNSYLPVLADRRFNTDRHIKVLSNVKVIEPREQVKELFGGVRYEIPHTEELEVQFLNGELFSGLTGKSSLEYNKNLEALTKMILGEEIHDGNGKTKSIKDKNSEKPMKNGIFSSIKLWKGGKERE